MTTLPDPGAGADEPAARPADPDDIVLREAAKVLEQAEPASELSMDKLDHPRRMVLVHAHPDDETIGNGVTMARYAAEGALVTLVTCTLGEEGEVLVPELEHLAANRDDALGWHRVGELAAAMEALGVTDHRFLGGPGRYRDSGMMGEPSNERPQCFWQADLDEAAGLLVDVLREVRPQVVLTYDENGGYGHPDHIQAHRVAMRGVELAADPTYRRPPADGSDPNESPAPWQVQKVYWGAIPESEIRESIRRLREAGDLTTFEDMDIDGETPSFVVPDEQISTTIDGTAFVEAKLAAMRAHATQISVDGPFFALSNNLGQQVWATEHYRLVRGQPGDSDGPGGREADLFSGTS
jgi:N-acetyl-1-D-myo-inositol-2-amino-2-deoxy-alpha-D-glucopyranoside deacetylase